MAERKQSGQALDYIEWVAETDVGVVPTDPDWQAFSDNVVSVWDGEPDASTEAQTGLGGRDPVGFFNGPEEHEFAFTYDLQQWYVDSGGAIQDAGGAIMQDTADNDISETHTVVSKEEHVDGGADSGGRYIMTVGKGGYAASLTVPFETEDGLPVRQELSYRFEKVREYSVSQPSSAVALGAASTDANDDTQSLTLENDDGSTTATINLNGTTFVDSGSTQFSSLAALELDAETEGDIVISTSDEATTPSAVTDLATIQGALAYDGIEGDLGVPTTASGSHSAALGHEYVRFREDVLDYDGTAIAPEISSGELSIDNGVDATGQDQSIRQSIDVANRETSLTASLAGPKPSVDQMVDYLTEVAHDITWTPNDASGGVHTGAELKLHSARLVTPGGMVREDGEAKMIVESEWQSQGVTAS